MPLNDRARPKSGPRSATLDVGERLVSSSVALAWLVRARWHTVGLAALALAIGQLWGLLSAPASSWGALVILALSNGALALRARSGRELARGALGGVLLADTAWLTLELALAGGVRNPLVPGYVVLVGLAALVLDGAWVAALVAAAGAAAVALSVLPVLPLTPAPPPATTLAVLAFVAAVNGVMVTRVVAALRSRQMRLAEAEREAARAEKLASLATLAAGAAHELNTPLGTIAIAASELESLIEREPTAALAEARVIRREVQRCKHVLERLGARAGGTLGELPQRAPASDLLERVRAELGPSATRLEAKVDGAPEIEAPLRGLSVVIADLVSNGLHASPPLAMVTLRARAAGEHVRFSVCDEGTGIAPELRAHLGEPFFTTKEPGQGLGLGMFLAYRFCAGHGARLSIESEPGRGTRVHLDWPAARGHA